MSVASSTIPSFSAARVARPVLVAALALLPLLRGFAVGAQSPPPRDLSPHSDVQLVAGLSSVQPGSTVTVAVRLTLDDGWHTYWTNPGDAGLPLEVKWTLPAGVTAGALQFPIPRLTPQPPLMSFGYEGEVFVLADVTIPASAAVGSSITLSGKAEWLACAEVCFPASGAFALTLPVSAAAGGQTRWDTAVNDTRAQLPVPTSAWRTHGWRTAAGYVVVVVPDAAAAPMLTRPYLFVDSASVLEYALPQRVARAADTLVLALPRAKLSPVTPALLSGVVTADITAQAPRGWRIGTDLDARVPAALRTRAEAMLADSGARDVGGVSASERVAATDPAASSIPDPGADMSLLAAIAFAFLGGLLLNLMPCVFPVLSVKVLALLEHGGATNASRGRKHGVAFGLGVLLSFWALAGVLMILRAGGESLGWGFQLQSPPVVATLALLMFALGLNLSGVFEIGLSLTRLGGVGGGSSYGDSMLTGGLAVLVAAPCTAPFMGAALGFALVQPPMIGLLVFTALGIGLAAPFVLLASAPRLLRFLPRPGPWLESLKQLFAFPLYATVVWLLWVFGQQAGIDALAIVLLAMIVLAIGAWLWARGVRSERSITRISAALLMLAALGVTLVGAMRPPPPTAAAVVAGWEPWSESRVRELRAEGRPVFVDFTAAWCLSCQVNERVALRTTAVEAAFSAANVALLRADWTSRDSSITTVLTSFGRSGVPLYVLYPAGGTASATLLPAVLTPGMVVSAIRKAAPTTVVSGVR